MHSGHDSVGSSPYISFFHSDISHYAVPIGLDLAVPQSCLSLPSGGIYIVTLLTFLITVPPKLVWLSTASAGGCSLRALPGNPKNQT